MYVPGGRRGHRLRPLAGALLVVLSGALACAPGAGATPGAAAAPSPGAASATGVRTGAATAVGYGSATLNGTINPAGQPVTYFFQYGPTATYGSQSLPASLPGGRAAVSVSSSISGLLPLARYHNRLVAVRATGTELGGDATFATGADGLSLGLLALPSPVAFGSPVSLVGHLSGAGAAARVVVLQQNPYPFTGGFQAIGNPQLTGSDGTFQFNLISLPVTTQFLVVTVGPGQPVSATLTVPVQLAVSATVSVRPTRRGYANAVFSGVIAPAQAGARVSVQRLVDGQWRLLVATYATASAAASAAGASRYSATLRLRHGGYYRVFATPIEDSHLPSFSAPTLVHVSGR